jgi:Cell division cycle-associated protein 8
VSEDGRKTHYSFSSWVFLMFAFPSFVSGSSRNGSPLETSDVGSVIATISKKRRGNESASFEINVGEGRYISLNDPNGVQELDSEMKATAATQLKVLQDQMASLMAQLTQ